MLLIGIVSYGRFVVLDAQGLIPVRARSRTVSQQAKVVKDREVKHIASHTTATSSGPLRAFRESHGSAPTPAQATQWVDGSEPEPDGYGDGDELDSGGRKLSKAELKRLRKLKARERAA
jgi:hypothetical protein